MKTFWTIVVGLFLLVGCSSDSSLMGNWVKLSDFGGIPRSGAVGFVIDDKAYVGFGYNSDDDDYDGYLKDLWVYDYSSDGWTEISKTVTFPGNARNYAVAFSINGKGYVGTGYDGDNKLADFWQYDPTTNTWTQMDNFPGVARIKAIGFSIGNYGYVGTGYGDDSNDQNDFYKFDPTAATGSQWTQVKSILGSKRRGATVFTYNSKAYVFTGTHNSTKLTDMYMYDPDADTWTKKIDLDDNDDWTIVRENACSFVLDGKAYVCLGSNSSVIRTCWEYDIANDTWNQKTDFEKTAREFTIGFAVAGKGFVTTGQSGSTYLDDVSEFRPLEEEDDDD
jgi:N-acetylneuraminic acid mutarotase